MDFKINRGEGHSLTSMKTARAIESEPEGNLLLACLQERSSFLAARLLKERHKLTICQSGAGYYLGCSDQRGPVARDSAEYYPDAEAAQEALDNYSWTQRLNA